MLQPPCSWWSSETWMTRARVSPPHAACSVPARSTQSRLRITSAFVIASASAGRSRMPGASTWSGWSVGNDAPTLRSVPTFAASRSASATRAAHAAGSRDTRPISSNGLLGVAQEVRRAFDAVRGSGAGCCRHIAGGGDRRHRLRKRRFLHFGIEIHVDRTLRRGLRMPHRAQQRLARGGGRRWLVVPFDVGPDDRTLITRRMDPVDPRATLGRVDRTCRTDDQHRHAITPRVEDGHRRVEQSDIGMHGDGHRSARYLGVAVRDRYRMLLVQAQQHLRVVVAEVVDEAVVQAAEACTGVERDVRNAKRAQRLGNDVAAELRGRRRCSRRPFECWFPVRTHAGAVGGSTIAAEESGSALPAVPWSGALRCT